MTKTMYQRVLAAIDLTANETHIVDTARNLADLTGCSVHLLHVTQQRTVPGEALGEGLGVANGTDVDPGELLLSDQAVASLTAAGVQATGQVIQITRGSQADVAHVILRRAQEIGADLIVLGEQLHGRASRLFRGSVADEVIHHHPACSVLLVP
jgi:nucleotide-binding universal stress UspA family protein